MSYAEVTAKGPKQTPEEAYVPHQACPKAIHRAAPVPSLPHSESESASLIDVDSPHVTSVKSDFQEQEIQTETQADRLEHEAEDKARAAAQQAAAAAESAKKKAATKGKEAKDSLKKDGRKLSENRDNPVVIGNALIWGIATVAIGYGAYQKHTEGKLDWKLASTVVGSVGAFAVADYFGSKWLLENKYPPK
ncbi:hypothetical protein A1O3_02762 [Capronia epimyces CBS 606.96]|uniref:Uncharacterized protein n=1 Tax=Capronia epimyces CBS 606.96 TaxID=1182542 RepID=W9YJ26_9EURO|nr:uncharacterized protein A1O3_02762 [Capronia epimyces CBS 606.96]EXJ89695.1 hypothetical protein A1O3_02762 [Capronia epimyces CBS 606.96]